MKHIFRTFCIGICVFFVNSCTTKQFLTFSANRCPSAPQKVTFKTIQDSVKNYDKQFVEIEGFYHYGAEESFISETKSQRQDSGMIAIDFDLAMGDLIDKKLSSKTQNGFDVLNGKQIRFRGIVYANKDGHFGRFIASINDVCFIKTL